MTNLSESITTNSNQNTYGYTEISEDSPQSDANQDLLKKDLSMNADISVSETNHPERTEFDETLNQDNKKKVKRKLGFLQMRIDSTIYFDNMGYSYQIQNEKNDKKYVYY